MSFFSLLYLIQRRINKTERIGFVSKLIDIVRNLDELPHDKLKMVIRIFLRVATHNHKANMG